MCSVIIMDIHAIRMCSYMDVRILIVGVKLIVQCLIILQITL
jgi:hypothetical protein